MKFTTQQIARFITKHYPRLSGGKAMVNWVSWAIENNFLLMVGDGPKLFGVMIIRPCLHPHKMPNNLYFDMEGDTYFVDIAIALSPKRPVLQALCFAALKRFGMRDKIAFQRHGGPVFVVDAHIHRKRLLRVLEKAT